MLSEQIKDKLKANWGDRAGALDCLAYVKVIGMEDGLNWACFIYAMDPQDPDQIETITRDYQDREIMSWNINDLFALYNKQGSYVYVDKDYKPKNVKDILKDPWRY